MLQIENKVLPAIFTRTFDAFLSINLTRKQILYVIIMGAVLAVGFIRPIVFASFLTPAGMGNFSIASTIASYGLLLQFGILSGLNRELPVLLGRNEKFNASGLIGGATNALAIIMIAGFTIFFIFIWFAMHGQISMRNACLLGGILAFSSPFCQMVILRLRAEHRILSFSSLQLANALVILFLGGYAIKYLGYKGPILITALTYLVSFIFISRLFLSPVDYSSFSFCKIIYLIKIGLPLLAAGALTNVLLTMDRFFLIKNASFHEVGVYHIAALPLMLGIMLGSIVDQYISPKLLFQYGQGESLKSIFVKSCKVSILLLFCMLLAFPLVPIVGTLIIKSFLPAYQECLRLLPVFYLGAIFICIPVHVPINAANRQIFRFFISLSVFLVCFISYTILPHFKASITLYAWVNVAGQLVNAILITFISWKLAKMPSAIL